MKNKGKITGSDEFPFFGKMKLSVAINSNVRKALRERKCLVLSRNRKGDKYKLRWEGTRSIVSVNARFIRKLNKVDHLEKPVTR